MKIKGIIRVVLALFTLISGALIGCGTPAPQIKTGIPGIKQGDYEEVVKLLKQHNPIQAKVALSHMPTNMQTEGRWHYLKARQLIMQHNYKRAKEHLEVVYSMYPHAPAVLNDLGVILIRLHQPNKALGLLQSIEEPTFYKEKMLNISAALIESGRLDRAIELLRHLKMQYPDDPWLLYNLGMAYFHRQRLDLAIATLKQAAHLQGDDRDILLGAALSCTYLRDKRCADKFFTKVYGLYPTDWQVLVNYGAYEGTTGNFTKAVNMFKQAMAIHQNCPVCLFNLAKLFDLQNNTQDAIYYYEKFLQLAPNDPWAGAVRNRLEVLRRR